MQITEDDGRFQRLCLQGSAHCATVLFAIGWVICARFLPAPSPLLSTAEITQRYLDNLTGIRVGITLKICHYQAA